MVVHDLQHVNVFSSLNIGFEGLELQCCLGGFIGEVHVDFSGRGGGGWGGGVGEVGGLERWGGGWA